MAFGGNQDKTGHVNMKNLTSTIEKEFALEINVKVFYIKTCLKKIKETAGGPRR